MCIRDRSETPVKTEVTKVTCSQNEIKEPTELDVPQDGKLEIEMETLAKPDAAAPDEKAAFISVILKEDTNLSIQYTYDTVSYTHLDVYKRQVYPLGSQCKVQDRAYNKQRTYGHHGSPSKPSFGMERLFWREIFQQSQQIAGDNRSGTCGLGYPVTAG